MGVLYTYPYSGILNEETDIAGVCTLAQEYSPERTGNALLSQEDNLMNRIYTKLVGVSYVSHLRGGNDMSVYRHWDRLKDENTTLDCIDRLLTTCWRGRKIAEVHVIEVYRWDDEDRLSEKSAGAYVVLAVDGKAEHILVPGTLGQACRKGTAVNRICNAAGEFNTH
jgi:hypothetical protein